MGARLYKGSKSNSQTATNLEDNRVTAGAIGLSGSRVGSLSYNDPDAVKAIAAMGADTIARTGAAVVELNKAGMDSNVHAWDSTLDTGAGLVDAIIDANTSTWGTTVNRSNDLMSRSMDRSNDLMSRSMDRSNDLMSRSIDANTSTWGTTVNRSNDLMSRSIDANTSTWGTTVNRSNDVLTRLIDASTEQIKAGHKSIEQIAEKGFGISQNAISSFQPAENKASETSLKLGMIAAAGVAATLLLSRTK